MYGSIFIQFVQWAPKYASFLQKSAFWPFKVVQGHPRSMILVPIEIKRV